ncbi:MAG: permease [Thermodesulfobacteriota bacterium]
MWQELVLAGWAAVQDYVATHVLTCLVPAFFLAGAMVTFIDRNLIISHLGARASRPKSFALAAGGSFLVAACSCTVIPVASGLFYAGAGIGPAFILLWTAPSSNLLSLIYTGNIIGPGMVAARIVAALAMATLVGIVMQAVFEGPRHRQETQATQTDSAVQDTGQIISRQELVLILLLLGSLLLPNYLIINKPYLYKVIVFSLSALATAAYTWKAVEPGKISIWLRETWWFVKTIFPLLIVGVFMVGIIGRLLPQTWIQQWLGGNGLLPSFMGSMIGSVSYFATLTEAPFVDTLMKMGMGKGPALALLLTGPGISLPSWIAVGRVFGWKKSVVYVPTIIFSGTVMGWFFGNFIF